METALLFSSVICTKYVVPFYKETSACILFPNCQFLLAGCLQHENMCLIAEGTSFSSYIIKRKVVKNEIVIKTSENHKLFSSFFIELNFHYGRDGRVPVAIAWRVLWSRMLARPPIWRVAANKLNKH